MFTSDEEDAIDLLHSREFAAARDKAIQALRCAPQSARIKALVFRVNAEEALANQRFEAAERELHRALALAREDPALFLLGERIQAHRKVAPMRRGVLATLFGRRATMPAWQAST